VRHGGIEREVATSTKTTAPRHLRAVSHSESVPLQSQGMSSFLKAPHLVGSRQVRHGFVVPVFDEVYYNY
jgi:hypothetical protein